MCPCALVPHKGWQKGEKICWACALERGDSSELPHPYRRSPGYGSGFSSKTSHIFAPGGTSQSFSDCVGVQVPPGTSRLSELSVNRKGQNEWALRPGGGNMGLNHPGANAFPAHPLPPYPTACAQWGMPVFPGCRTFTLAPKGWQRLTGLNC